MIYLQESSSTLAAIEKLHTTLPFETENIHRGRSGKAQNAAEFTTFFRELPKVIHRENVDRVTPEDRQVLDSIIDQAPSHRALITRLQVATRKKFAPICNLYLDYILHSTSIRAEVRERFMTFARSFAVRLSEVRPMTQIDGGTTDERAINAVNQIIIGGVSNAAHHSWSFSDVLPHIPAEGNGHPLTPEECTEVSPSIEPLMIGLVSSHDDVFNVLSKTMRRPIAENDPPDIPKSERMREAPRGEDGGLNFEPYHAGDFCVDGRTVELRPSVFERAKALLLKRHARGEIDLSEPRVGCPGIVLIPTIHRWCRKGAIQCLYPRAEHIRRLPRE